MARSFRKPNTNFYNGHLQNVVNIQLTAWREQMLSRLLPWMAVVGTVAIAVGIISVVSREKWVYIPVYVVVYLALLVITIAKKLSYKIKATVLLGLAAVLGVGVLSETGLSGVGPPFLLILPIAAVVLLDWRYGVAGLLLSTGALLVFGSPDDGMLERVLAAVINAMLSMALIIALHAILQNLTALVSKEQRSRQQLRDISDHLEQKANKHTKELHRRTAQLAVGSEISQAVSTQHDLTKLLTLASELLVEKLNFHHVSILIMDADNSIAELEATAGEAADKLLEQGRVVEIGERSLVGWCLEKNEAQIRQDNSQLFHPLLPETRSTMALPLRVGKHVLGAIEVHNTRPNAFEENDIAALQNAADYISLIIQNARLAQQARSAIKELETSNRLLVREAWREHHLGKSISFAEYHLASETPWTSEEVEALTHRPISHDGQIVTIPLTLYGAEIGHIVVEMDDEQEGGPSVDSELLHSLAQQVSTSLETARLLEESQRRAAQEQTMTKISAQVRTSLDPDTILKTAVRELGRALGARFTTVEIKNPVQAGNGSSQNTAVMQEED